MAEGKDPERRIIKEGIVTSDKMDKTIVVKVETSIRHPQYSKVVKHINKFKVHDPQNQAKVGQTVRIAETRPLSKEKRWRLVKIIK